MKVLLDENVAKPLIVALRTFVASHELAHIAELGWSGTKDLDLYARAATEGYNVVVTNDEKQMQRPQEVRAIAVSGVHRIQYPHRHSGLLGLGVAIGTVCAGLPLALQILEEAGSQRLIRLPGLDPTPRARLTITDPTVEPVKHWPVVSGGAIPAQPSLQGRGGVEAQQPLAGSWPSRRPRLP